MLTNTLFRLLTFQVLVGYIRRQRDDELDLADRNLYWDLVYLYRFGLPEIVWKLPFPWPPQPQPDPLPLYSGIGYESLLLDVVDVALGEPHSQPNRLRELLGDNESRITAARNLIQQYEQAIPQLQAEISRLEKLS